MGNNLSNNVLESILHGVILTDLRGHITFWNDANQKILGYKKEEILGKSIRILYAHDEKMPFKKILRDNVAGNEVYGRWYAYHKSGKRVWLDVRSKLVENNDGKPEKFVITICNIGKLKFTESRLKKNTLISQAIFDTSVDAMITINERGRVQSINRTASKMFGYSEKELVGKNVNILMPFPHNVNHNKYLESYAKTGSKNVIGSRRVDKALRKDGTVFPVELAVTEVQFEGSKIFAAIIKDISERRELEKKILEVGEDERRKIGRDLHDGLGQLLTGIRMLSENLERKLRANALPGIQEVSEITELVKQADQEARSLARGMVQVDIEKRGLSVALELLCKQVSKMANIECEFRESGSAEINHHDMALHLYRIAQEGINNAVKHGEANNILVRLSSNEHHTSMMVDDDGKGFHQSEVNDLDAGLGLQIMHHRATILGGICEIIRSDEGLTRLRCIIPNNLENF